MRSRHMRLVAALLAAASLGVGQMVFAHGGGGGGGGGHGGGGGGGHGGGFGGGHGGGFGGGHGGGYGGGMHHGGGYGGGMGARSFSSPSMHSPSSMGRVSGSQNLGGANLGGSRGLSGAGARGLNGVSGASHVGANSHINQSIISNTGGARHTGLNSSMHTGQAGHLTGLTGRNGSQLAGLGHTGAGLNQGHHSQFLANHGVHNAAFRGNNLHNVNNTLHHNGNFNHFGGFNRHHNNFFFSPFFFGGFWPWWLWGYGYGYGYGGYGYGYGGYGGGYYGYGYPYYGYNPYCTYGYSAYGTDELAGQVAADQPPSDQVGEFAAVGETDFKAGNYEAAVRDWRHAILDDPTNGTLVLMLAQALFANAKFDEAAGALQQGMLMLPDDQWGVVVSNYTELYPKIGDYTNQLRALEKAVKEQPDSPALRFLVGYHYGYLGYPQDALKQLAKAKTLAPQDEMTKRLYDALEAKANKGDGNPAGKKADAELPPQAKAALPTF